MTCVEFHPEVSNIPVVAIGFFSAARAVALTASAHGSRCVRFGYRGVVAWYAGVWAGDVWAASDSRDAAGAAGAR